MNIKIAKHKTKGLTILRAKQQEKAGELSLALRWGYADISEANAWADNLIRKLETPSPEITKLSLADNPNTAITILNKFSQDCDPWDALRLFLQRFANVDTMTGSSALRLARLLEKETWYLETGPEDMRGFNNFWILIDMAIHEQLGNPEEEIKKFLNAIKEMAKQYPL